MSVHRESGDALEGERVACQCRKYSGPHTIKGTGAHRATRFVMSMYVYCVIEKPLIRTS